MTNKKLLILILFTIASFISLGLFNKFNSYELVYAEDDCNLKTFHYTIDGVQNSIEFDYMINQFHYWAFYDCNNNLVYRFDTRTLKKTKYEKSI